MALTDLSRAGPSKGPATGSNKARGPVAIVDIGSNSVRLVVYEAQNRIAASLQNEKSICGIGRDMVTTGRLHAETLAVVADTRHLSARLMMSAEEARKIQPGAKARVLLTSGEAAGAVADVIFDRKNPRQVLVAGSTGAFYSLDGGEWYSRLGPASVADYSSFDLNTVLILPNSQAVAVSVNNGLFIQDGRDGFLPAPAPPEKR